MVRVLVRLAGLAAARSVRNLARPVCALIRPSWSQVWRLRWTPSRFVGSSVPPCDRSTLWWGMSAVSKSMGLPQTWQRTPGSLSQADKAMRQVTRRALAFLLMRFMASRGLRAHARAPGVSRLISVRFMPSP